MGTFYEVSDRFRNRAKEAGTTGYIEQSTTTLRRLVLVTAEFAIGLLIQKIQPVETLEELKDVPINVVPLRRPTPLILHKKIPLFILAGFM